jgi:hypothetical protein
MNYQAIATAMRDEINDPKPCYMPNSPAAFVRDRLFQQGRWEDATWFWGCVCRGKFGVDDLDQLNNQLKQLDANEKMPEWGTRGT